MSKIRIRDLPVRHPYLGFPTPEGLNAQTSGMRNESCTPIIASSLFDAVILVAITQTDGYERLHPQDVTQLGVTLRHPKPGEFLQL